MISITIKDQARELVDGLPDNATWEDVEYQIYFRQAVESGRRDSAAGRVISHEEAMKRFGVVAE